MAASRLGMAGSFNLAVLTASYAGTLALLIWPVFTSADIELHAEDLLYALLWIAVAGILAIPFVAIGLLVFGVPVALALRPVLTRPATGIAVVLWGAATGKLVLAAVMTLLFNESFAPLTVQSPDPGLCYGVSASLVWWWLERRRQV